MVLSKSSIPLRRKVLVTFLPIVLIPLAIAGVFSGIITYRQAVRNAQSRLSDRALLAAELTRKEISTSLELLEVVSTSPAIVNEALSAVEEVTELNLSTLSLSELEAQFAQTRLLSPNQAVNNYLQRVAEIGNFAEVFFTEANGYTLGYSQPTSDFVQSDEDWWKQGQQQGQSIGEAGLDQSSNTFGVELIQDIRNPQTGAFLGVLKAEYAASNLNLLAQELESLELTGSERLQIIEIEDGGVVLTTLSAEGGIEENIIGEEAVIPAAMELLATEQSALITSITQGNRRYTLATIPGTDWVISVSVELAEIRAASNQLILLFSLLFLSLGILVTVIILGFAKELSDPLNNLAETAERVAEGDLNAHAEVYGSQETQTLARSFNEMVTRLQGFLQEKEGVQRQAMQLLLQIQDLTDSIQKVAANTQAAEEQVQQANQVVQAGDESITHTVIGMQAIQVAVEQAKEKVEQLQSASQQISKVVMLVKNFTDQTNVLALNASVEAARAGVEGEGFAVVAKEVRSLAQQSAEATQQIRNLVAQIQQQIREVAVAIQTGANEVIVGAQLATQTQQELNQITTVTHQISVLMEDIAQTSSAQAQTSASLSQAIQEVAALQKDSITVNPRG